MLLPVAMTYFHVEISVGTHLLQVENSIVVFGNKNLVENV